MDNNIPHYLNNPEVNAATAPQLKLFRPKIHYGKAVLFILVHIVISLLCCVIWFLIANEDSSTFITSILIKLLLALPILFFLTLRITLIWFVRVYQHYAKSETRLRCCMTPSCSEYAIIALKKYGAICGGVKTFRRLLRCHPPGGIDYP